MKHVALAEKYLSICFLTLNILEKARTTTTAETTCIYLCFNICSAIKLTQAIFHLENLAE